MTWLKELFAGRLKDLKGSSTHFSIVITLEGLVENGICIRCQGKKTDA
jgi:hypothetical protein